MNYNDIIEGYLPTLIEQYKRGENPKELTEAVFKDVDLIVLEHAIDIIREKRTDDDGPDYMFLWDSFANSKAMLPNTESRLLTLYAFLIRKQDYLNYGEAPIQTRAILVNEIIGKNYQDAFRTLGERNELISLIINSNPREVKRAINGTLKDPESKDRADEILNKYFPGEFPKP